LIREHLRQSRTPLGRSLLSQLAGEAHPSPQSLERELAG
jgi:hypothetical protein